MTLEAAPDAAFAGALATAGGALRWPRRVEITDMPSVVAKKTVAQTAVERDRKFALPVAPNRLPEAPLPNDAPLSAPLPCGMSTRPIMAIADRTCRMKRKFDQTCILFGAPGKLFEWGSGCRAADGDEVGGLQRGASDQAAVDVFLREQRRGVL